LSWRLFSFTLFVFADPLIFCFFIIIFLYPAKIPVSSVSIVNMDDAGDTASAAAMSTLIVLTSLFVRLIYEFTSRNVSKKSSVWINPLET
jgi:ABC-type Fe3+ transport system permease subunit